VGLLDNGAPNGTEAPLSDNAVFRQEGFSAQSVILVALIAAGRLQKCKSPYVPTTQLYLVRRGESDLAASISVGAACRRRNDMKTKFLAMAMALASLFGAQQAFAKHSTKTTAATKKHHKHHMKKTAALNITVPNA
jgi:hypothetical protein